MVQRSRQPSWAGHVRRRERPSAVVTGRPSRARGHGRGRPRRVGYGPATGNGRPTRGPTRMSPSAMTVLQKRPHASIYFVFYCSCESQFSHLTPKKLLITRSHLLLPTMKQRSRGRRLRSTKSRPSYAPAGGGETTRGSDRPGCTRSPTTRPEAWPMARRLAREPARPRQGLTARHGGETA